MKRLFALVMVLCLLCSAVVTGYAEAVSVEEYLAWVDRAWPVIKDVFENYWNIINIPMSDCYYRDSKGQVIYPNLDFLLAENTLTLSKEQVEAMNLIGFDKSQDGQEKLDYMRTFFVQIHNEIAGLQKEYESFANIPLEYEYLDSQITSAMQYISEWHNAIYEAVESGLTCENYGIIECLSSREIPYQLKNYGQTTENIAKEAYSKNISFIEAIENVGLKGNMNALYTLLG